MRSEKRGRARECRLGPARLDDVQSGFEDREERDMIEGGWPSIIDALERVVGGTQA